MNTSATDEPMRLPERPNVIWFLADQHRAQALSGFGDPNLRTPVLDRMIGAGRTAIAGSPLCSPFRGSLLTGRYPHRCVPGHDHALPEGMKTIADAFHAGGYRTAWFGKWHLDGHDRRDSAVPVGKHFVPPERRGGFGCWIGYENNNAPFDCWVHGHDEAGTDVPIYRLPGYETDALTDLLLNYVDRQDEGRPFFAAVSVQPPHCPYVAPPEDAARHRAEDVRLRSNVPPVARVERQAREELAGYYAMIENIDANVGRLFARLKARGWAENTVVIYFSDHGDMHGSHGRTLKCVPWEESVRVPFLVARGGGRALAVTEAGAPELLNHVDIFSTTLGLGGIAPPAETQGRDASGYFRAGGPVPELESAYLQLVDPGYRYGFAEDRERPWRGVVTREGWKYAVLEGQPWLMYNLREDPFEQANLVFDGRFKSERARLQGLLQGWIERTGDKFELPEIG